jgi:hypothetical protein
MFDPGCRAAAATVLLTAALAAGVSSRGAAGPPATAPAAPPRGVIRDLELTIQARRVLAADETLGPLNLIVEVRGGVATVSGPVPSPILVPRAVGLLGQVRGLFQVRSDLYIVPEKRPPEILVAAPDVPTVTSSASPDPVSGSLNTLTGRAVPGFPKPDQEGDPAPAASAGGPVALLPPETAAGPAPGPPVAPASPSPGPAADDLARAVERLRRGDERYAAFRVEARGGVLTVRGPADRGEDAMRFARALSGLPGVARVAVEPDSPPAP